MTRPAICCRSHRPHWRLDDLLHLRHRHATPRRPTPCCRSPTPMARRRTSLTIDHGPAQRHQRQRRQLTPITYTYLGEGRGRRPPTRAGDQTIVWFNDLGLPARVEDPLGGISSYLYDNNGNLVSYTDAAGDTYQYTYDSNGNLTQTVNPLGQTVQMTYNSLERADLDHRCRQQHDPVQLQLHRQPAQDHLPRRHPAVVHLRSAGQPDRDHRAERRSGQLPVQRPGPGHPGDLRRRHLADLHLRRPRQPADGRDLSVPAAP